MTAGALWPHTQPSPAMETAYRADPVADEPESYRSNWSGNYSPKWPGCVPTTPS